MIPSKILLSFLALAAVLPLKAQRYSVSTDVLSYADRFTIDAGASVAVARRWTVNADVKYNPFTFGDDEYNNASSRQRMAEVGARYWLWHSFSGWWMGTGVRLQEYNRSPKNDPQTREGERYGASFTGGYSYMLTPWLNLDVAAGLWTGHEKYRLYDCPVCGTVLEEGSRTFILPAGLMLNLSFVF